MTEALYCGKAKTLYQASEPGCLVMEFRDDVSAFNGKKVASLPGKGAINCSINTLVMEYCAQHGIATHFVRQIDERTALVKAVKVLPIECIFRNRVAGSFMKKYGLELGTNLRHPVYEYCVKSDVLGDPLIVANAITALGMVDESTMQRVAETTRQVNELLCGLFSNCGYQLVDGKLEFGLLESTNEVVLVDEFTPDSCRLWTQDNQRLDKDLFREGLGDLVCGYRRVYNDLLKIT